MTITVTQYATSYLPRTSDRIVTSFVPLETTFTPDPDCSTADFHNNIDAQFDYVLIGYDPRYSYALDDEPVTCVPPELWKWFGHRTVDWDTVKKSDLPTVWSMMPVTCPHEWYTALEKLLHPVDHLNFLPVPWLKVIENSGSGYTVDPYQDHSVEANCFSTLDPGNTIYYYPTTPDDDKTSVTTVNDILKTAFSDTVTVAAVAVKGYMHVTPTTTSAVTSTIAPVPSVYTTIATSTSPPVQSPSVSNATTSNNATETSSSHLSGGAIAGSVIGSLAGVGLIGLGAFMFFRRRKAKQTGDNEIKEPPVPGSGPTTQYSIVGQNVPGDRSTVLSELPTISNTPELFSEHDATSPRTNTDPHEVE